MLVRRTALADNDATGWKNKRHIGFRAAGYAAAVLFCCGLGYIAFDISSLYFSDSSEPKDIIITNMKDITETIFTSYSVVIIILAAAALMTFISFTVSGKDKKEEGEVQK
jgi:NADH:ubiquinone oxidoreductase subunit 6 (subunit J)